MQAELRLSRSGGSPPAVPVGAPEDATGRLGCGSPLLWPSCFSLCGGWEFSSCLSLRAFARAGRPVISHPKSLPHLSATALRSGLQAGPSCYSITPPGLLVGGNPGRRCSWASAIASLQGSRAKKCGGKMGYLHGIAQLHDAFTCVQANTLDIKIRVDRLAQEVAPKKSSEHEASRSISNPPCGIQPARQLEGTRCSCMRHLSNWL